MSPRAPVALILCLLVVACAPVPTRDVPTEDVDWREHRRQVSDLGRWQAEGRVALEVAGEREDEDEGYTGSMSWTQAEGTTDFRVRGPFGLGGFRVFGDEQGLWVRTSRGEDLMLADPVADMDAALGWHIPVRSMRHWVLGIPDPDGAARLELGERGLLRGLEQSGWRVTMGDYRPVQASPPLPHRVTMAGEGVSLRFVIHEWRVGDAAEPAAGP